MKHQTVFVFLFIAVLSGAYAAVNDPVISAVGGASTSPQTVTVTVNESTSGATLYYTTDGSNPTTLSSSIVSGGTLLLAQNTTLNVQAFQGTSTSNLVSTKYTVNGAASAGSQHTLLLKNDGTVWAFGDNSAGELGSGNYTNSSQPVQVLAPSGQSGFLQGIVAIAADNNESFAVDNQGNLWAWGQNTNGQLGIGTTTNTNLPVQVPGISGAVAVSSSQYHTLVLKSDGTVWGWGANTSGQVGNGAMTPWETQPVQVMAAAGQPLQGIVAVSAGASHTLAIDNQGNVWAWGANGSGQLGNGDSTGAAQAYPVQVTAVANAVAVVAGTLNGYALESNGSIWAWGDNSIGELGNGGAGNLSVTPVQVSGLVSMIGLGNQFAFDTSNTLWAWGDNTSGRLGLGAIGSDATLPLQVSFFSGTASTLADLTGNNQSVNAGAFSSPLTVTVTNNGQPVQNTLVDFIITGGGGLLATSPGSTQLSGILQVLTNSQGQASIYFQEPAGGSGSTQITATSGNGQSFFSLLNGGAGVPMLAPWAYILLALCLFLVMARYLPKKLSGMAD